MANKTLTILLVIMVFCSCTDDTKTETLESSFIPIQATTRSGEDTDNPEDTPEDYKVHTLRILVFNTESGKLIDNTLYRAGLDDVIRHPIEIGTYKCVFLANEPPYISVESALTGITNYDDLKKIAYPSDAFTPTEDIPMMQEIKSIEVLQGGTGAKVDGAAPVSIIQLALERLAARVDVILKSKEDLESEFTGITFTNVPDEVPLTLNYTGTRKTIRVLTQADSVNHFAKEPLSAEDNQNGIRWAKRIKRVVIPANEFTEGTDKEDNAVVLTVNLKTKYNPSVALKINDNYTLPHNSALECTGIIKEPLELNIKAASWDSIYSDWTIAGNRILNVSQLKAEITDFNGVRISFTSNMPRVRILENCYVGETGTTPATTNYIFNDLAIPLALNDTATTRFEYKPSSGSGYMDIIVDQLNAINTNGTTYRLILSAETESGKNALQREIKIKIRQYGTRYDFNYNTGYVGAFFRDDEIGERIITGQQTTDKTWSAQTDADWITLSTTPSFDPTVGTDNPQNAELYLVEPNWYKTEEAERNKNWSGGYVEGKGRIYFRIGTRKVNNTGTPRYATVMVARNMDNWNFEGSTNIWHTMYIRQGHQDDYIVTGGSVAREFSPYNLTAPEFKKDPNKTTPTFYQLGVQKGEFVDFPTQAGAFFQWGNKEIAETYHRRAYHPTSAISATATNWNSTVLPYDSNSHPWWNNGNDGYENTFEVCPTGYHRPSDGYTDQFAYNGKYPHFYEGVEPNPTTTQVNYLGKAILSPEDYDSETTNSEWRVSLFPDPAAGDGGEGWNGDSPISGFPAAGTIFNYRTYPERGDSDFPTNLNFGYYADGFFDRRPIITKQLTNNDICRGVSLDNAEAAYGGTLIYNGSNSIFFPAAGRRKYDDAALEWASSSGYFWSSSVAPRSTTTPMGNIWSMEFNADDPKPISAVHTYGYSIRCVKD